MTNAIFLISLTLIGTCFCSDDLFESINQGIIKYNAIGAEIGWQSLINPSNSDLARRAAVYQKDRLLWQHERCDYLSKLYYNNELNASQNRQTYLLCRGPKFTYEETRKTSYLYEEVQSIYNDAQVCFPAHSNNSSTDFDAAILKKTTDAEFKFESLISKKEGICLIGEKDFENVMKYSKNESVLKWTWSIWRENMRAMKMPYLNMLRIENKAAKRNGYKDMGASWRDETELPNLRQLCYQLYESILPLYKLLHGVARYQLRKLYGNTVPESGPIPAHLLGDLWSQNWESLAELIIPRTIDFDERINKLNWTVDHMVKRGEDFYTSLGLPEMTDTFWRESVFRRENTSIRCHGTAADMFKKGDYRLLYCADITFEDLYVIHHEMGHIQYYMAYNTQPGLYRQANTALHEAIGDTIMLGVATPQHLQRLGLLKDQELYNTSTKISNIDLIKFKNKSSLPNEKERSVGNKDRNIIINKIFDTHKIQYEIVNRRKQAKTIEKIFHNVNSDITTDDILILKHALNKIPQIPFAFVLDEYRWRLFEGKLDERYLNVEFWELSRQLQGIAPIEKRGEEYFDVGAKYHVADNIPYTRYFLSSFLQYQLFERLCKGAIFGRQPKSLPDSILLHRCDIYGSKAAGKVLRNIMSRGNSQHWLEILNDAADIDNINSEALKRYYRPLYKLLKRLVAKYNIPIGW
ncbi:angiotensin-converting enzyme-like [Pieris brassicae]|uniref:angiotensin-converting enzyme-like n=1 Tax=Pieris brassicae TaxID=7116 RepID=UPI001E65E88E|nr:angiotensin-converting enzyme-like [Pieris brassicae]